MSDDTTHTDLKVQIEGLKKDIQNVNQLNQRLDIAIERLTDVSTSIKQMLAVHEEKLNRQEQIDEIIFQKIKEKGDKIDKSEEEILKIVTGIEKRLLIEIKQLRLDFQSRVGILEKYKWIILGAGAAFAWVVGHNFPTILEMIK